MKSITAKRARRTHERLHAGETAPGLDRRGRAGVGPARGVTGRTWCAAPRKPLFLRRRAPRLPEPRRRQRVGRGAPLTANPYSFVAEHHVFRDHGAGGGPDVVLLSLQTLIPSSPSTTSSGAKAPATGRTWCAAPRKPLFLRRQAPRLPRLRRRQRVGRGAPLPANPCSFVAGHHVFRGHGAGVGVTRRKSKALRGAKRQLGRPRAGRFRFFISNSMTFLRIRKN